MQWAGGINGVFVSLKKINYSEKVCFQFIIVTRKLASNLALHVLFVFFNLGVNLLVGTESGLMLLDRSGQGKVYPLINRRRFQQMDVLEGLNVLVTISGKALLNKLFSCCPWCGKVLVCTIEVSSHILCAMLHLHFCSTPFLVKKLPSCML